MSLVSITNLIADVVEARANKAMMYGVVLLSDRLDHLNFITQIWKLFPGSSLLDYVPEIRMLFDEINSVFQSSFDDEVEFTSNGIQSSNFTTSRSRGLGKFVF